MGLLLMDYPAYGLINVITFSDHPLLTTSHNYTSDFDEGPWYVLVFATRGSGS